MRMRIAALVGLLILVALASWAAMSLAKGGGWSESATITFGVAIFCFLAGILLLLIILIRRWGSDRRKKCNTCGKSLSLPIGADHFMCALRHHPFRSLLGWLLVIFSKVLGLVGCPASRLFRMKEALLRRQIRREAFRKGLRPGGKRPYRFVSHHIG
jgi:hypothetical protein